MFSSQGFGILDGDSSRPPRLWAALAAALAIAVAMLLALASPASALQQKVISPAGAGSDQFGFATAVEGDTLVVGAPGANSWKGAVYVYERSGAGWTHTGTLTASDGVSLDRLGYSVDIDGDTIVAGADIDDEGANDQGSVYTFSTTGAAARTETGKLTASDGGTGDRLGKTVAIDGDTIVAGAFRDDIGAALDQGSVYTFSRTGAAARTETAKLTASDGLGDDELGSAVDIDGDTIVAGALTDDIGANSDQGSAYTFARTGAAARTETAKLVASDGAFSDQFGYSIALEGDTIVVGSPFDAVAGKSQQGSAYTFARTGAALRNETAKLTASDGLAADRLGSAVDIDAGTIVAGAFGEDLGAGEDEGAAYTFARTGAAARNETAKLTAADAGEDDELGTSVAVDGTTIAAGAPSDTVDGNINQGSVEMFFTAPAARFTLNVTTSGAGGGQVTATGINCPGDCNETYDDGTIVTLTAAAAAGSSFSGWSGDCAGSGSTCQVTMDQARTVEAQFSPSGSDIDGDGVRGSADQCPIDSGPARTGGCPAYAPPGPKCATTIVGTESTDTFVGSAYGNQFEGLGGDDDLQGMGGDDCLFGGEGSDALLGGEDNDKLKGSSGSDSLGGAAGNDRLRGGRGKDAVTGDDGDDRIVGGAGKDELRAGPGDDKVRSRGGFSDEVNCGSGEDLAIADRSDRVSRNCETVEVRPLPAGR